MSVENQVTPAMTRKKKSKKRRKRKQKSKNKRRRWNILSRWQLWVS